MCGIVGLFAKSAQIEPDLGRHLTAMLEQLTDRGPDSTGFAIYRSGAGSEAFKLSLARRSSAIAWSKLADGIEARFRTRPNFRETGHFALFELAAQGQEIHEWLLAAYPDLRVDAFGRLIEVYKDIGKPSDVCERFALPAMSGRHAIGHTRMATESAVTVAGSHPFSTGPDQCLVHNGSLSNHNRLRRWLQRRGMTFQTDNDSEVAASYLALQLKSGESLETALQSALADIDGFFTFCIGTADGFAVMRDAIACKPAVLAENDDWVAIGSEYRALAELPGIERARVWEPEPGVVYSWRHR